MDSVVTNLRLRRNGESYELDTLGFTNGRDDQGIAFAVEIKSRLRQAGIRQFLRTLHRFADFVPEHRHKKLYGILAAVDVPHDLVAKVHEQGIYLARVGADVELMVPEGFQPRCLTRD